MDLKKSKRLIIIMAVVYCVFAVGIYAIANEQFRFSAVTGNAPAYEYITGEFIDGVKISEALVVPSDLVEGVHIMVDTYSRPNTGTLNVTLESTTGAVLAHTKADISTFENYQYNFIPFAEKLELSAGEEVVVTMTTEGCTPGNAITIYAGRENPDAAKLSRVLPEDAAAIEGYLCVKLSGYDHISFYKIYWVIVISCFLLLSVYTVICWRDIKKGKNNYLIALLSIYSRYAFLIKQLVARDFKTKYKRSSLGMAWSFLNPLLTMIVQYIVFSQLFKSNIPNYPVYLLTGIVFFGFLNEALSLGMTSITSNASLVKKVYMPKYIYPVSRILSSLVNFGMAMLPLFLVILLTGTAVRPAILLLVFDVLCFLAFIIGMALLLTTAMTFFQDTQFLWNVASMMWQYLTPIFYPESIIPDNLRMLYRLNPMYQFITFARTCIIDGVSPQPNAYFFCTAWAIGILIMGIYVFRKHQNKFVLYL